jgi:ketosteroid isomerase-like protein
MAAPQLKHPNEQVLNASLSGDVELILSMYADNAIVMPPNDTTLWGKEEIRAWWEDYLTFFRVTSNVESEREFTEIGDQAYERSLFSVTIVPKEKGARILDEIRSLTVWRRESDGNQPLHDPNGAKERRPFYFLTGFATMPASCFVGALNGCCTVARSVSS